MSGSEDKSRRRGHAGAKLAMAILLSASLAGCVPWELSQILDGPQGKPLAISPSATVLQIGGAVTFAASGGVPPYTYVLVSGGGSVDPVTGLYTAPVSAGAAVVRVTDKTGKSKDATITVQTTGALVISPSAVSVAPGGSVTFVPIGGTPPYSFSMQASGSGSPSVASPSGVYTAGSSTGIDVVKLADSAAGTATATITVTTVPPPVYTITSVPVPTGSTTGQAVSGTFTIHNGGTAAGSAPINWQVYASLGDAVYNAGDILLASGSTPGLGISGTSSPGWAGTWPSTAGTWYIVVRASAADAPPIADAASLSIAVTDPPPPNYTVSFNAAIPWSGQVGTLMSVTGTPQITISNLTGNTGHATITWSVYLSTDNVLDAGDTLIAQGTNAALGGLGSVTKSFDTNWPAAPGKFYWFIATVSASDDSNPLDNTVTSQHAVATGDYRYQEGAEDNSGVGPNPPAGQTSTTGVNTLGANQTLVIEGVMDAYNQYDTYKFTTVSSMSRLSTRAMWGTGFDDIDLYLWDTGSNNLSSVSVGLDSEPGAGTFDVTGVTPRTCYISANFYLAGNTSGSTGQKYIILVRGLP
jgi:hypothetical protein